MAHTPQDILDRIASLEREVRQLRGEAQTRPAMNRILNGNVRIGEGGSLEVEAPSGAEVFGVGQFGNGRYGVSSQREDDGSTAFQIGGNAVDTKQMIRTFSRGGDVIMMDDAYADGYLGRPWVPIPMAPPNTTNSTSWSTMHAGRWTVQHAVLIASWSCYTLLGTTAETRLVVDTDSGAQQLGEVLSVSGGDGELFTTQRIVSHGFAHGVVHGVRLQARIVSGSDAVSLWCRGLWGDNTSTPDEA